VAALEASVEVRPDGRVVFDPPLRLPAGKRRVVLVVEEAGEERP
jgi:hypothetical protein